MLIPDERRGRANKLTLCISSQVGCAIDCQFCATATLGFGRNLTPARSSSRSTARRRARRPPAHQPRVHGHGRAAAQLRQRRPCARAPAAPGGAALLAAPDHRLDGRAGPGIEKLGSSRPAPNLAISLNATTDEVRDRIMPINKRWPIAALLDAARALPAGARPPRDVRVRAARRRDDGLGA